jgi:hypothetical protein
VCGVSGDLVQNGIRRENEMQSPRRPLLAAVRGVKFGGSEYIGIIVGSVTGARFLRQFIAHDMMSAAIEAAPTTLR